METEHLIQLECNVDDATPETLAYAAGRLLQMGALDVWMTPIVMKKGRPGVKLSVLARPELADSLTEIIFRETTTLGVRRFEVERMALSRRVVTVETEFGPLEVKLGCMEGRVATISPEYESCRAAAEWYGVPLKKVYDAAREAAERIGDGCPEDTDR
jgi:uncharacterized protein (DUF111 family)